MDRQEVVMAGKFTSSTCTLSIGAPLGRVRHPLLFSLFTHECTATHGSNPIVKFADDTVVVGLIKDNNKAANWSKVKELSFWCKNNNLDLNISRWKGQRTQHEPIKIYGTKVEIVSSCKFLAVHISENLTWARSHNLCADTII